MDSLPFLTLHEAAFVLDLKPEVAARKIGATVARIPRLRHLHGAEPQPVIPVQELFRVDVERTKEIERRLKMLERLRATINQTEDGTPLLKGTHIDAYRVAALAATSEDEARFEYPSLSARQIEQAVQYADIYPKPGHPHPNQSLKRLLLTAEFDELNEVVKKGRETGAIFEGDEFVSTTQVDKHLTTPQRKKGMR